MFRKALQLWVAVCILQIFAILLQSCSDPKCYIYNAITLSVFDNGDLRARELFGPDEVYATALLIRINMQALDVKCLCCRPLLIQSAFASYRKECRSNSDGYYPVAFKLFSNSNYDALHPAGKDLSDLCRRKGYEYYLMSAPDDTGTTHVFTVQVTLGNDSTLESSTPPLKLLK